MLAGTVGTGCIFDVDVDRVKGVGTRVRKGKGVGTRVSLL